MKTQGLVLPLFALGCLAYATVSIVRSQPDIAKTEPPQSPPRSGFAHTVAGTGLVECSSENIAIAPHLPGVVAKVFVKAGDKVRAGAPLFQIDTRALDADLAQREATHAAQQAAAASARARIATATATLKEAQLLMQSALSLTASRAISADEVTQRRAAVETATASLTAAEAEAGSAEAQANAAAAASHSVRVDLERSTVTAPLDAEVLQVRIRPGEYATPAALAVPLLILGQTSPLHVRIDVDEQEAWRVSGGPSAVAHPRGNATLTARLTFVRAEPLVIPKQSLTGSAAERVDTRVLQLIYRIESADAPLLPGQLVDVFMEAKPALAAVSEALAP
ncbi:MAG: efflux RND transporter periplasmic adaptor subunit [Roseimicrobium sp.]